MITRSARLAGFALLLAVPAQVCGQDALHTGRAAAPDAVIRIVAQAGSIRVGTWERDSVLVTGRVDSAAGRLVLVGSGAALKLGIEPPPGRSAAGEADLDIRIPVLARLRIESGRADVDVTAGGGDVEVSGGSGRVRLDGRARSVVVETLDGNVELALESPRGQVRTASGTIVVRGLVRDLEASTVSGPLLVGMEGAIARARLETVSSEIAFKGDLDPEGHLEAETHGGDVELRLPIRLGAAFHLVSYGGGLVNELVPPSAVQRGPGKGEWTFHTGDGRATVNVITFKGRVTLKVRGDR
jgi:hypothetical protein